ncbi:MAG TPA: helix-turn-helix domain-containing protein [Myxococcota bacterium]|nr:helix-turn-helix domain-containing protein [Myxococcota bacterium]
MRRAHRSRRSLANAIIAECVERLPHYRDLSDSFLAEVRKSVVHHLALFYDVTLDSGRALTDEDLAFSRRVARLRASQGVPIEEFLTFFLVGLTVAWRDLMAGVGEDPVLRTRLLDLVTAVIVNQTHLMTALTAAYVEERQRLSRFREQDQDDFVQLLLADEAVESAIESRARVLGIALDETRSIAIFAASSTNGGAATGVAADDLRRELAERLRGVDVRVGRARQGFVALLAPDPDPKLLAAAAEVRFGQAGRVGFGSSGCGVAGLRRSAREALRALEIGLTLRGNARVHAHRDVAVLDLVGVGSAGADEFARSVLGPLLTTGRPHLATLRALARNGYRMKLAAAALEVHPHTLSYRAKQIRARYGLDLDDSDVRLRVQLALLILDAQGDSAETAPGSRRRRGE